MDIEQYRLDDQAFELARRLTDKRSDLYPGVVVAWARAEMQLSSLEAEAAQLKTQLDALNLQARSMTKLVRSSREIVGLNDDEAAHLMAGEVEPARQHWAA